MTTCEYVRSADGTRIAYRRLGAGQPIVAVHGGLGSSRSWEPVARLLADRHEVFLVDRRGRGDSDDGDDPHRLAHEIDDVRAVLDVAGAGATLLGHSFGGTLTLELATLASVEEIGALVVYEPAVGVGGLISDEQLRQLRRHLADGVPERAVALSMRLLDDVGLVVADGPLSKLRIKPSPAFRRLAATVPREISAVAALHPDPARYAAIDVPVLVLVGERSPEQARRNNEALAAAIPDATVAMLERQGHVAHTAAPELVAAEIDRFLVSR